LCSSAHLKFTSSDQNLNLMVGLIHQPQLRASQINHCKQWVLFFFFFPFYYTLPFFQFILLVYFFINFFIIFFLFFHWSLSFSLNQSFEFPSSSLTLWLVHFYSTKFIGIIRWLLSILWAKRFTNSTDFSFFPEFNLVSGLALITSSTSFSMHSTWCHPKFLALVSYGGSLPFPSAFLISSFYLIH